MHLEAPFQPLAKPFQNMNFKKLRSTKRNNFQSKLWKKKKKILGNKTTSLSELSSLSLTWSLPKTKTETHWTQLFAVTSAVFYKWWSNISHKKSTSTFKAQTTKSLTNLWNSSITKASVKSSLSCWTPSATNQIKVCPSASQINKAFFNRVAKAAKAIQNKIRL